jgi:GntR family transcriptional repressor for pyruvate dehydrogenase complex
MGFAPVKRLKLAEQLASSIRSAILQGAYGPGDTLPSERDLAGQFEVNRSSVREAILRLEAWGLVEVKQGGGTRVRDFLTSAGLQVLPYLLAPAGELDGKLLRDLLEIRVMLLGWTAAKAAERSAGVTASKLRLALERLDAETEIRGIQEADFDFFEKLVELTDNQVLNLLANAVRQVYMQNSELFGALYLSPGGTELHHETLRAVEAGDVAAARAAMEAYGRRFLEEGP